MTTKSYTHPSGLKICINNKCKYKLVIGKVSTWLSVYKLEQLDICIVPVHALIDRLYKMFNTDQDRFKTVLDCLTEKPRGKCKNTFGDFNELNRIMSIRK